MINSVDYDITVFHYCVHIAFGTFVVGAEISFVVSAYGAYTSPCIFGMYNNGVVKSLMKIKNGLKYFAIYIYR